jgi:hypothetical protein
MQDGTLLSVSLVDGRTIPFGKLDTPQVVEALLLPDATRTALAWRSQREFLGQYYQSELMVEGFQGSRREWSYLLLEDADRATALGGLLGDPLGVVVLRGEPLERKVGEGFRNLLNDLRFNAKPGSGLALLPDPAREPGRLLVLAGEQLWMEAERELLLLQRTPLKVRGLLPLQKPVRQALPAPEGLLILQDQDLTLVHFLPAKS